MPFYQQAPFLVADVSKFSLDGICSRMTSGSGEMMKLVWLGVAACIIILFARSMDVTPRSTSISREEIAPIAQKQTSPVVPAEPRTKTADELVSDGRAILADGERQRASEYISEMDDFETRWLSDVQSSARAEYVHYCGLRSIEWQMRVQGLVEGGMARDPQYLAFNDKQRAEAMGWRDLVRNSEIQRNGQNGSGCRSISSQPWIVDLDQMATQ
ncbi:hypothetical protein U1763_10570 [Sphingomonas sp. LB2R24]|uniref:hypothetical protein n=1 Tax=Sphingomonas sorbitolis TaxID=3096165 RepID=UPI002FCB10D9